MFLYEAVAQPLCPSTCIYISAMSSNHGTSYSYGANSLALLLSLHEAEVPKRLACAPR